MINYKYQARDTSTGKKVKGNVEADSEKSAMKALKDQGYSVVSIKAQSDDGLLNRFTKGRISTKDKVLFARQLSTLINAGMPLVQSLRSVQAQTKSEKMKTVISEVVSKVEGGKSFSEALTGYPRVFNKVFVSLVAAGETSGTLDRALERIANQQEKDAELISKVRGAMIYPIIVLLVMVAVVGFMIVAVLPQVKQLYEGLPGTTLPFVTRLLLAVSDFFISYWWLVLIGIAGLVILGSRYARSVGGKRYIDSLKISLPLLGSLFRKLYMARFARTATTLVGSGVPLIQTLDITGEAIDNYQIETSLKAATEKVKGGKALSESLEGDTNFIDLVPQMIKIGEESGSLEQMLDRVASYFEKEVDNAIKNISTIIEPVLMIVLGIVSFVIVSAILLPIYGLVGSGVFN